MALDENYSGSTRIRDFWPKIKSNLSILWTRISTHTHEGTDTAQISLLNLKDTEQVFFSGTTTDGTAKELFINGVNNSRLTISDGTAKAFSVIIIAYEVATNSTVAYRGDGYIRRSGSTTTASADNTTMIAYSGVLGWVATVTADDVNDSLKITVTGAAGKTIKWKASVRMASV